MTTSEASAGGPPSWTARRARPLGHTKSSLAVASKSGAEAARNAATAMWAAAAEGEAGSEARRWRVSGEDAETGSAARLRRRTARGGAEGRGECGEECFCGCGGDGGVAQDVV